MNIPIFMYHSIESVPKSSIMRSLHTPPRRFKFQMWLLMIMGYKGLSLRELKPYLDGVKTGKVVGITFDDGYKNNLINAAPILKQYNFSATCYLVSDYIGESNIWDLDKGIDQKPLMNYGDIQKWVDLGMDIGAHTQTHSDLTKLNKKQFELEISKSKDFLENQFKLTIGDFCYPYGCFNESILSAVKKAGFVSATTMIRGRVNKKSNMYKLPRIPITHHTLPHLFLMKLLTSYEDKKKY